MIRVTINLLPGGNADRARTIGIIEIANIETRMDGTADYAVALKKTPPFAGALKLAWKKGVASCDDKALNRIALFDDDELMTSFVQGHHRERRGVYDLLFRALRACGLDDRAPRNRP